MDASVRRILTLKLEHGFLGDFDPEPDEKQIQEMEEKVGGTENHALEWEILQKGVTLLKNDGGMLPIEAKEGEKVLVLYSADDRMAGAEFARLRLVEEGLLPESVSVEAMAYEPENEDACLAAAAEANIPAAICGAFGEYSFSGILPVNIPKMGEDYTFTEEMLYERGSY